VIAGAYLRKSTAQEGVADDDKSVKLQREHVKAFAAKRGWLVRDEYIFEDDGKSGAEFARRPGYMRLMASLKPHAPFGVLIMYDETRLGREQIEVGYALKQIVQAGVEVWFSKDERRRTLGTPVDKFMISALNFAAEEQRVATAERTRATMERKARAGHVTGGCVFGYANVADHGRRTSRPRRAPDRPGRGRSGSVDFRAHRRGLGIPEHGARGQRSGASHAQATPEERRRNARRRRVESEHSSRPREPRSLSRRQRVGQTKEA